MKTMKTVESRVLQILRDCPETRNEDMLLFYHYYNRYAEHYATTGDILTYLKENGISCDRKQYRATLRSSVILVLILKKKEAVRTAIPLAVICLPCRK